MDKTTELENRISLTVAQLTTAEDVDNYLQTLTLLRNELRAGFLGREKVLIDLLTDCRYPLLVAQAEARSSDAQEDLEDVSRLIRRIAAAIGGQK